MEEKKKKGRLKGSVSRKYSATFKLEAIEAMHRERMGYRETARRYLPEIGNGTACTYIRKWERIYFEEGPEGLAIERRGRSSKRPIHKPLKPEVEKDLIERIQYLEMENEYLKKLKALVSNREREEKKNRK